MNIKILERLPSVAATVLVVLVVGACAIRLRGDEDLSNSSGSADQASDPLATKLAVCRSVTYEQKDALSECRKVWAEKRRQFLGHKAASGSPSEGAAQEDSSLFVPPKDESRLPPGYFQQSGKE
jgi:conjugative transfer region protein TrbK